MISVQAVEPIKIPQLEDTTIFTTFLQQYIEGNTNIENEINSRIYKLYQLSEEEIKYIEHGES